MRLEDPPLQETETVFPSRGLPLARAFVGGRSIHLFPAFCSARKGIATLLSRHEEAVDGS